MKQPQIRLDAKDLKILDQIQQNASLTNAELARRVRLSPSPCLARIRALEANGVITRYVALLDAPKVGLNVSVFIHVSLEKQVESALEDFEVASSPQMVKYGNAIDKRRWPMRLSWTNPSP